MTLSSRGNGNGFHLGQDWPVGQLAEIRVEECPHPEHHYTALAVWSAHSDEDDGIDVGTPGWKLLSSDLWWFGGSECVVRLMKPVPQDAVALPMDVLPRAVQFDLWARQVASTVGYRWADELGQALEVIAAAVEAAESAAVSTPLPTKESREAGKQLCVDPGPHSGEVEEMSQAGSDVDLAAALLRLVGRSQNFDGLRQALRNVVGE